MNILFIGGPFHGLKLGVIEIQKFLAILSIPGRQGVRRFAYLPRPEDWPEVLAGRMKVDESDVYHYYELISTPQGLQFRSDHAKRSYRRAIASDLIGAVRVQADEPRGFVGVRLAWLHLARPGDPVGLETIHESTVREVVHLHADRNHQTITKLATGHRPIKAGLPVVEDLSRIRLYDNHEPQEHVALGEDGLIFAESGRCESTAGASTPATRHAA